MTTTIFLDGSIYSPADPFATAMLTSGGTVEWVGQDAGARSIQDDTMHAVPLNGDLITPTFTLAAAPAHTLDQANTLIDTARSHGYGQLHLFIIGELLHTLDQLPAHTLTYINSTDANENTLATAHGVYYSDDNLPTPQDLTHHASTGTKVSLTNPTPERTAAYLTALAEVQPLDRLRLAPRIDGLTTADSATIERARELSVTLAFSSDYRASAETFAAALAAGVSVALGSDPHIQPQHLGWDLVSVAVNAAGESAVSARAAFQSMTRGPQRAAGASNPMAGQLVPSAPATFARWNVTELMVQTPDNRISAWSTDPRARTPLLPALAADVELPTLQALYLDGVELNGIS